MSKYEEATGFSGFQPEGMDPVTWSIILCRDLAGDSYEELLIELCAETLKVMDRQVKRLSRDQAATPRSVEDIKRAIGILQDALYIAALCKHEPAPGIVVEAAQGPEV